MDPKLEEEMREYREAAENVGPPYLGKPPSVCDPCCGHGKIPRFEQDEFNPRGVWEWDPCLDCGATGLSKEFAQELEHRSEALSLLREAYSYLSGLTDKLTACKDRLHKIPSADGSRAKEIDNAVLDVAEEIEEIVDELGKRENG